jgi:hypothetical protein
MTAAVQPDRFLAVVLVSVVCGDHAHDVIRARFVCTVASRHGSDHVMDDHPVKRIEAGGIIRADRGTESDKLRFFAGLDAQSRFAE